MTMRDEPIGTPAGREPLARPVEMIIMVIGVFICIGLFMDFRSDAKVEKNIEEAEDINLRTRAAICDFAKGVGADEPATCAFENVQEYRDPNVEPGNSTAARESSAARAVLCAIVTQENALLPEDLKVMLPPEACPPSG